MNHSIEKNFLSEGVKWLNNESTADIKKYAALLLLKEHFVQTPVNTFNDIT